MRARLLTYEKQGADKSCKFMVYYVGLELLLQCWLSYDLYIYSQTVRAFSPWTHGGSDVSLDNIALRHRRPADNSKDCWKRARVHKWLLDMLPTSHQLEPKGTFPRCPVPPFPPPPPPHPHYFRPGAHNDIESGRNGRSTPEKQKGWLIPPPVGCVK